MNSNNFSLSRIISNRRHTQKITPDPEKELTMLEFKKIQNINLR